MNKLRIFWDIDCVLADMIPQVCKRIKEQYNIDLKPQQIDKWDLTDVTGIKNIGEIFDSRMYLEQKPFAQAVQYLPTIWDKTDSYLATYCMNGGFDAKKRWLKKHFPFIDAQTRVVFLKYKSLLNGHAIVDDNYDNCVKWLKNNEQGIAIMPAYAYNDVQNHSHHLFRVNGWQGIKRQVDRLMTYGGSL